jgi:polyhydroxyalkanoate synthase subunit PhaC
VIPPFPNPLSSSVGLQQAWMQWSSAIWQGVETQDFPIQEQSWIHWLRGDGLLEWQHTLQSCSPAVLASFMAAASGAPTSSSNPLKMTNVIEDEQFEWPLFSLSIYSYSDEPSKKGMVVLIPPCSHQSTIFDLTPEQSIVRHLLAQQHDVMVLNWKIPSSETVVSDKVPEWSDYRRALCSALQIAYQHNASIHAMGLCLGGVMLLDVMLSQQFADQLPSIQSIVLLSAQLDYSVSGPLSSLDWFPLYQEIKKMLGAVSWIPAQWIYMACSLLLPSGIGATLDKHKCAGQHTMITRSALAQWSQAGLMVSARLAEELLHSLCRQNNLLLVPHPSNRTLLSNFSVPLYIVSGLKDRLVPALGVFRGLQSFPLTLPIRISDAGHLKCFLPKKETKGYQGNWQGESLNQWKSQQHENSSCWIQDWSKWIVDEYHAK